MVKTSILPRSRIMAVLADLRELRRFMIGVRRRGVIILMTRYAGPIQSSIYSALVTTAAGKCRVAAR